MLNKRIIIIFAVTVLFCSVFMQKSSAQNTNSAQPEQSPTPATTATQQSSFNCDSINTRIKDYNFSNITKERDSINTEMGGLTAKIKTLNEQIPDAFTKEQIRKEKERRAAEEKIPKKTQEDPLRDNFFNLDAPSQEELKDQLKVQEQQLFEKNGELKCLDLKISSFNTPEQDFKKTMSIIFAILIGLVIVGFFILSWRDEIMRRAIFSGQTGIQFLTLFSIVIAIILFGITGILEDKELAALLGGLSGYILGRYSSSNPNPPPVPPVPPV